MQKVPRISRFFLCTFQKNAHPHTYSIRSFYTQIKNGRKDINHDRKRITEKYVVYNANPRQNCCYCLQQSRNFSHGGLLCRSGSDHPAGMRAEKAELRCILERLSNQPVQPSAPAGAGHPTRRQTTGKEAAPGRYPHRTGDFIRHCIKKNTGYKESL